MTSEVLYNSLEFILIFLPVTLGLYYVLAACRLPRLATFSLVAASIIFYGYWDWHYLWLIGGSILFNFTMGALLQKQPTRLLLAAAVAANLALLAYYKYSDFFIASVNDVSGWNLPLQHIVLPLGISFFTFTQIAFLVDSFRHKTEALNFNRYVLFVTFFPHVIAGPIVHHRDMMSQFAEPGSRRWTPDNVYAGIVLFTLGLFKKVLIADQVAGWVGPVFDTTASPGFAEAWAGALAFTFQLYFDFSGYSDMAIGLALMFNIRMPDNFNAPYKSESIIAFWQRWHITLSRFLRDYLYIPLGGSRRGEPRRYANLLITMLLGGIWHGAGWTFVIWGLYHGFLLVIAHAWRQVGRPMPTLVSRPVTFICVVVGWVIFRSTSMTQALTLLKSMVSPWRDQWAAPGPTSPAIQYFCLFGLLAFVNVAPTSRDWLEQKPLMQRHAVALAIMLFICLLVIRDRLLTDTPTPFLYFQF